MIDRNKVLYLMRGISGTGKSKVAFDLADEVNVYSTDEFWYFLGYGKYAFDPNRMEEAHRWNEQRVEKAMLHGLTPLVVDNMNLKAWHAKSYVKNAEKYDYRVEIVEPDWSPELRDKSGKWNVNFLEGKNTHDINRELLQQMADQYEYDLTVKDILSSKAPDVELK